MVRQFSAGGAVKNGDLWLVIKPRASELFPNERVQLPKGQIEKGESMQNAALREVYEETGIKAEIVAKIGTTKYPFKIGEQKVFKIVTYFLMEYVAGQLTTNNEVEELFWLPFDEARKKLTYTGDKKILDLAASWPGGSATA